MELAYKVQAKIKSTYRLDIGLHWAITHSDIERLQDILAQGNVSALKLHVNMDGGWEDRHRRHDSLFNIMRHPSTQSVAILGAPAGFIQGSSLLFQKEGFPNLRHLYIDLSSMKENFPDLRGLLARTTGLSSLGFQGDIDDLSLVRLFMEIAECQTYPITFTSRSLCIPPLATLSDQSPTLHHYLSHFLGVLDVNGVTLSLVLKGDIKVSAVVDALAKVEMDPIGVKTLELRNVLGQSIKNVATIVSRSELSSLVIDLTWEGEERVQILESIQWKHIRSLDIEVDKESTGTRAMKALVEGRDKEKGQVELDYFEFYSRSFFRMSSEWAAQCKSFVASTSIKRLVLGVDMTPSDMESVLNSMDVTRLELIWLRAEGYSSSEVDRVLDCLTNAHNLQKVELAYHFPTQEQIQRMQERGVTLCSV
ncbi:hypothetical protein B0O80DRAFT_500291 [Mortierella sp. GBAus27b]|nr:hypothetical protein B0O80DRAFT_500291 [Mortierella sp. GBAus27b]